MVEAAERDGDPDAGVDPGRVLVREPGRGAEHDRGQQGLPVPLRHRLPLQPGDPAADGGARQPGPHRHRARPRRRFPRRAARLRPRAVRSDDRYVWLNQYANPSNWMAHYRTTAPAIAAPVPGPGRAVRRRRHHRHPDGLRALLPRVAPAGAGRRGRQRRARSPSAAAGPPDDSRPGHERAPAAARRVLRRRRGARRGGRTPSGPATGSPGADSCSAAPPARWSAARWTGSPRTTTPG